MTFNIYAHYLLSMSPAPLVEVRQSSENDKSIAEKGTSITRNHATATALTRPGHVPGYVQVRRKLPADGVGAGHGAAPRHGACQLGIRQREVLSSKRLGESDS